MADPWTFLSDEERAHWSACAALPFTQEEIASLIAWKMIESWEFASLEAQWERS